MRNTPKNSPISGWWSISRLHLNRKAYEKGTTQSLCKGHFGTFRGFIQLPIPRTKLLKCMTSEKCLNPCPPPKRRMEPEKGKSSLKPPFLGSMVFVGGWNTWHLTFLHQGSPSENLLKVWGLSKIPLIVQRIMIKWWFCYLNSSWNSIPTPPRQSPVPSSPQEIEMPFRTRQQRDSRHWCSRFTVVDGCFVTFWGLNRQQTFWTSQWWHTHPDLSFGSHNTI